MPTHCLKAFFNTAKCNIDKFKLLNNKIIRILQNKLPEQYITIILSLQYKTYTYTYAADTNQKCVHYKEFYQLHFQTIL